LNAEQQAREILGSKERLEEISGTRVTSFAYPFGEDADYDATSVRLVEAAGFASAGSVRDIAVSRSSPQYELPRVVVRDWDAQRFERQLEWWLRRGL
jgi:peptidoglycan/xylan/chitin deacetylase (PgdA/CDA1 family)